MSEDWMRSTYEKHLSARDPVDRAGCASPEALLALVERRGTEADRLATLNHAMSCPACQRDLDLLRAVRAARRSDARRVALLAIAATVLVAAGVGMLTRNLGGPADEDQMRGTPAEVALVAPRGAVTLPLTFVWHARRGAQSYQLLVIDAGGTTVLDRVTADTTVALPATVPMRRNRDYYWTVTARLRDGSDSRPEAVAFRAK